jgi:hypothetical protein
VTSEPGEPVDWPEDPSTPPPPRHRGTNMLAVASLVLAILWVFGLGSLLAVGLGYVAMRRIAASEGAQEGMTVAVAGVVLGLVGVGALILFLALNAAP